MRKVVKRKERQGNILMYDQLFLLTMHMSIGCIDMIVKEY